MKTQTKETQSEMTPQMSLTYLEEGNQRFLKSLRADRNLLDQVKDTKGGQYPFAAVLSCIDSRVPVEIVFDQGIGDLFSARVAGNFVNEDILGSIEYACKVAGSKLVVVLGHTSCGAVKGACDDVKLGNITGLLSKIKPAVEAVKEPKEESLRNSGNIEFVNNVSKQNVMLTIENMRNGSEVLKELEASGDIQIIGAMYHVDSGKIEFYG
ncbi:carbonic anhydrase family protein [Aquimarina macrocephali]|uniref:carbonic anhydrase family protein n=1 Tax=Aquimarina macrocephali TaxID=666563 RepID=UPI000463E3D3|nr:carbonic anhydrase family protein [Aquimarina macrocephali]